MYSGDKTCKEVFSVLSSGSKAALVDVRTSMEWDTIGVPDLAQISDATHEALFVEWQMSPNMQVNAEFAEITHAKLEAMGFSKEDPVYFLCRSGVRSKSAASAMTAIGYTKAFNVLGGFEGDPNETGQRTRINGWVFDQLPSKQHNTGKSGRTMEQRE